MTEHLVNGVPTDSISADDRGLLYGDGLFETVAVRAGQLRLFDYHLDRLHHGCARLGLEAPTETRLRDEAESLLSSRREATLRITLTRGRGPRGYAPVSGEMPTRILSVSDARKYEADAYLRGVRVRSCENTISINPSLAGLKSLNRLDQVLARAEWSDARVAEGLMSTHRDQVICGTMSNVFWVADGRLLTPDLSTCGVAGVMRRLTMELAERMHLSCQERSISKQELRHADEVFLTNSQFGLWPVRHLDDIQLDRGPITQALIDALGKAGVSECRQ